MEVTVTPMRICKVCHTSPDPHESLIQTTNLFKIFLNLFFPTRSFPSHTSRHTGQCWCHHIVHPGGAVGVACSRRCVFRLHRFHDHHLCHPPPEGVRPHPVVGHAQSRRAERIFGEGTVLLSVIATPTLCGPHTVRPPHCVAPTLRNPHIVWPPHCSLS